MPHLRKADPMQSHPRLTDVIAMAITLLGFLANALPTVAAEDRPPNFILIFVDNLGYGDVGCFGPARHKTPHLDQMAAEGMKLTHCYATAGVCTPSRASLMTGCYPRRVGLDFPDPDGAVLRPMSPNGLHLQSLIFWL